MRQIFTRVILASSDQLTILVKSLLLERTFFLGELGLFALGIDVEVDERLLSLYAGNWLGSEGLEILRPLDVLHFN